MLKQGGQRSVGRGEPPLAFGCEYVYSINMAGKVNSVNIKKDADGRGAYHHGDLRGALIRAGVAALDSGVAVDALSLRALARDIGVSPTAVYRHFPDKAALLAALALAALDRMGDRQAKAAAAAAGPVAAFSAMGVEYVRFALDHPALFRLIWTMAPAGDLFAVPAAQSHPAMAGLRAGIAAILPREADGEAQRAAALACWGLVHGLAMLALDRQIQLDDAIIARIVGGLSRTMERA